MARRRHIVVVSSTRADYGIYRPVLRALEQRRGVKLSVLATGTHMAARFGNTVRELERDGFAPAMRVPLVPSGDDGWATAAVMGKGLLRFAQAYRRLKPDLLLLLGDRFEMFAAAAAAVPVGIPMAHIHGGETTEGAMDEQFRHAISKMSHLHFAATRVYRDRLICMGEEPWRITVSGAPGLDNLKDTSALSVKNLEGWLGMSLQPAPLLVTFHPVTLEPGCASKHIAALLGAIRSAGLPVIFTHSNADPGGRVITHAIEQFLRLAPVPCCMVRSLGAERYGTVLRHAAAMVGNSSSGIIEAASVGLPVVNVGNRQKGRLHGRNVVDVPCEADSILRGVRRVTTPQFRRSLRGLRNPYGDGRAAERIAEVLAKVELDERLLQKRFHDV